MSHDHDHSGQEIPSDPALRVKALESLLVEKGLVDPAAIDAWLDLYENKVGPHNGARVVARAWMDAEFKRRLLADATPVLDEMDLLGKQGHDVVVVENTADNTILSFAPCARAIRGRCSVCRHGGINRPPIARAPQSIHGACCANSVSNLMTTLQSTSGIARRKSATSCCQSDPRGLRFCRKRSSQR